MTPSVRYALVTLLLAGPTAAENTPAAWTGEQTWEMGEGWEASGSGEVAETDPESRSRTLTLGMVRNFESGATTSLGTTLSDDPAAELRTLGADLGAEAPLGPLSLSVGLTANAHRSDVVQPERVVRLRRRTVIEPAVTERLRLWEFHPSATVSLPLFGGAITPSFYTGRTFFSSDPATLSERIGELDAPRAEQVAGHIDGFQSHDGEVALDVALPAGFSVRGAWGGTRGAVDGAWTASRAVTLGLDVSEDLGVSTDWNRSIAYGERTDSWTARLNWSFGGPPADEDEDGVAEDGDEDEKTGMAADDDSNDDGPDSKEDPDDDDDDAAPSTDEEADG